MLPVFNEAEPTNKDLSAADYWSLVSGDWTVSIAKPQYVGNMATILNH